MTLQKPDTSEATISVDEACLASIRRIAGSGIYSSTTMRLNQPTCAAIAKALDSQPELDGKYQRENI